MPEQIFIDRGFKEKGTEPDKVFISNLTVVAGLTVNPYFPILSQEVSNLWIRQTSWGRFVPSVPKMPVCVTVAVVLGVQPLAKDPTLQAVSRQSPAGGCFSFQNYCLFDSYAYSEDLKQMNIK